MLNKISDSDSDSYTIRRVALKAPPPLRVFAFTHLILELHYCALVSFPKISLTPCGEIIFLIEGQDLGVMGVSKFKVDMIFIIFHEFNMMLEIVDS